MDFHPKKMAVYKILSQNPISLKSILEILGQDFPERSVRRWLQEMVALGLIEKIGQKRATKYRSVGSAEASQNEYFSKKSLDIIANVRKPIYTRDILTYKEYFLNSYLPNKTFYIPEKIRFELDKAGKRSHNEDPAGTYARKIYNRLLIDLSYNSSRLEGNTYSLLDTERLILQGTSAEGKLDEEAIMILNHKEAIEYLVESVPRLILNVETICTLHFLLSDGLLEPNLSGKVRDHEVKIDGSSYIPLIGIKKLQSILEIIVNKAAKILDPFEQSFFLLIHISYLQAFTDVNKRTARLSANIPLIKNNLVPLAFKDVPREDYTSSMIAIYELQEVQPLLEVYVFSYLRTCAQYNTTIQAMGYDEVRVKYRYQRRDLLREIILQTMIGNRLKKFISEKSLTIKEEDRSSFIQDILEDLEEMDEIRMTGLGITLEELKKWQLAHKDS